MERITIRYRFEKPIFLEANLFQTEKCNGVFKIILTLKDLWIKKT